MSSRLEEKTQPRSGSAGNSRTGSTTTSTTTSGTVTPNNEKTEKEEEREADIKIILLGDSAAGKSKLVERFLMNEYVPRNLSTHALTVFRHKGKYNGKEVNVDFWDTAGQERFASMHPSYYYRADACILVFDVTRKATYQHLTEWYQELQQYRPGLPTLVVANKIDVNYEVVKKAFNFPQTREHCHKQVYFCSAADGTNVVKLFHEAIGAALKYKESPVDDFNEEVLRTIDYFDSKSELKKAEAAKSTTAK